MEQSMSKTQENYGSGVTRPTINQDTPFELKGQFLKELRDNTFSGSEHEDANEHIEKVLEIVDLFSLPKVTQDQIMLRAFSVCLTEAASRWLRNQASGSITTWEEVNLVFHNRLDCFSTLTYIGLKGAIPSKNPNSNNLGREIKKVNEKVYAAQVGCELCKGPHYTKGCPQKEEGKTLEEAYYTQFGAPYQPRGQYRAARPGFYQRNNGNSSYPDRRPSLEESLTKFMAESAKRHEENSNIIKEIRASTDAAIRNQGASIKTLEIQIGYDVLDVVHTPYQTYSTGAYCLKQSLFQIDCKTSAVMIGERGIGRTNVLVRIGKFIFPIDFIILDIPEDDDVPLILGRPFLSIAHSKIDVFKRKITLRVGEEKLVFKSFTIVDDDDMAKDVVLGMKFCKKYASCQMIMKKFALGTQYGLAYGLGSGVDPCTDLLKLCYVYAEKNVLNYPDMLKDIVNTLFAQDVKEVDRYGNANLVNSGVFCEDMLIKAIILELKQRHLKIFEFSPIRRIQLKRYGVSAPRLHKKMCLTNSQYGVVTSVSYVVIHEDKLFEDTFWSTIIAKTINGEEQLHALVDGKKIIITESSVRRDLQLADEEGVDCLPNSTIFEQLTLMGTGLHDIAMADYTTYSASADDIAVQFCFFDIQLTSLSQGTISLQIILRIPESHVNGTLLVFKDSFNLLEVL
ncbi:DNA-directed DNA polymerase [Tanacetum coccineum]